MIPEITALVPLNYLVASIANSTGYKVNI
jgi:hypothetical protein